MINNLNVADKTHVTVAYNMYKEGEITGQEYLNFLSAVESYRLEKPQYKK